MGLTTERNNLLVVEAHAVEYFAQVVSRARLAIGPGRSSSCKAQPFMSGRSESSLPCIVIWPIDSVCRQHMHNQSGALS